MAKLLSLHGNPSGTHANSSSGNPQSDWAPVAKGNNQIINKHSIVPSASWDQFPSKVPTLKFFSQVLLSRALKIKHRKPIFCQRSRVTANLRIDLAGTGGINNPTYLLQPCDVLPGHLGSQRQENPVIGSLKVSLTGNREGKMEKGRVDWDRQIETIHFSPTQMSLSSFQVLQILHHFRVMNSITLLPEI